MSSVLRAGAMTSKDLVTRFRHLLKSDEVSPPLAFSRKKGGDRRC